MGIADLQLCASPNAGAPVLGKGKIPRERLHNSHQNRLRAPNPLIHRRLMGFVRLRDKRRRGLGTGQRGRKQSYPDILPPIGPQGQTS